jgi:FKBP-type peptidyl-prolyl cis-trans isomerase
MKFPGNKWIWIAIALLLVVSAGFLCRKQVKAFFGGYEKSELGYNYRFLKGHKLDKIKGPGFHIVYQYVLLGPKGDTLENGSKNGVQQQRNYPTEVKNFIDEAMQIAAPGAIVEILVPTDSLMLHDEQNMKIMSLPKGENAKFVIHVLKVLDQAEFEAYQTQRMMERVMGENKLIDAFAAKKTDVVWQLDSAKWIKYYITKKTEKPRLQKGDMVEFHFEIYKLSGELIQSSLGGRKFKITIGKEDQNFVAFDFVTQYLADGENGFFLVTSDYGFGAEGFLNVVKPYTPLAVKLSEVKKLKE